MRKPLISVIVPVYKVENCIERCLESLRRQTLQDIEIILVDDASPDRCGEICETYAAKDNRFKVFHHPKNRGLSAARNKGISNATCDYLMFVDSDDCVHEDFCRLPYECAVNNHADLVLFWNVFVEKPESFIATDSYSGISSFSGFRTKEEALELLLQKGIGAAAWDKLYHKSLFQGVSYPPDFYFEDWGTTYKTVLKAKTIYFLDRVLYYHCYRKGSITTLRTIKAMKDKLTMMRQQWNELTACGYHLEKLESLLVNFAMSYCIVVERDLADSDYVFCDNLLRSCERMPVFFSWKQKVLFVLFKYSPPLFELVCTLWGKKLK